MKKTISRVIQNRLFVDIICPFVLLVSCGLGLFSPNLITMLLWLAIWPPYFLFRRNRKGFVRVLIVWTLFILSAFSPVDISFKNFPGPPRLVPLVMGLPMGETWERAKHHEILLGGCVVTGHEPKYILVW